MLRRLARASLAGGVRATPLRRACVRPQRRAGVARLESSIVTTAVMIGTIAGTTDAMIVVMTAATTGGMIAVTNVDYIS